MYGRVVGHVTGRREDGQGGLGVEAGGRQAEAVTCVAAQNCVPGQEYLVWKQSEVETELKKKMCTVKRK